MTTIATAPTHTEFIPLSKPCLGAEEERAVLDCLRSGWITTGPRVAEFERAFQARLGRKHAVAVNSATAGWHLVARSLGIGPGDEVVVPAITWVSSPNVVELLGARVVFADVLPGTLQIDPDDLRRQLGPRTKAVIPVHFAGAPCALDALRDVLAGTGVRLIEDAAHAPGAAYRGCEIGAASEIAIFSFHPIKNLTSGEGGMIVLDDDALAERLRLLRFHGVTKDAWGRHGKAGTPQYEVVEPGFKCNMLDLQAAIGIEQLRKLDTMNAARVELAARYDRLLADVDAVRPLERVPYPHRHAWSLYVVELELERLSIGRDECIRMLADRGVGAGLHFPALHTQPYYRERYGLTATSCPAAARAGERILSLPLHPLLTAVDQSHVCHALRGILETHRK